MPRVARRPPAPATVLVWTVVGFVALSIVCLFGVVGAHSYAAISSALSAEETVVTEQQDCIKSSMPCTDRERWLTLKAQVDAGTLPIHKTAEERQAEDEVINTTILDLRIAENKASLEQAKARWERERYRQLQQELQTRTNVAQAPAVATPTGAISCDTNAHTRAICDRAKR